MNHDRTNYRQRQRRRWRIRARVQGTPDRPRLSVFRSHKHMYAQIIDDLSGKTLASASTRDKDLRGDVKYGGNKDAATAVGKALAEKAIAAGIKAVAFDRGSYKFHGRVAAVAAAAREGGLAF